MPVVTVNWWKGISDEARKQMVQEVTGTISRIAECPQQAVTVIVQDVEKSHWGLGGEVAAELQPSQG